MILNIFFFNKNSKLKKKNSKKIFLKFFIFMFKNLDVKRFFLSIFHEIPHILIF